MSSNSSIAKNTLFLYFRMILIMAVQLYTVRVVLSVLGSTDYGLNNVVGGVVTMFSFLSGTMATASQRYFSYEIGRNDMVQLKKTFSSTLIIYCLLGVIILVLAETIGLWFLNNKMVIPSERIDAANWVYQFSVFSFIVTMFQVPYDALVIAREKMNVYAYVSIFEVVLKLLIVYLLSISSFDKLITYSFLTFSVTLIITSIYKSYCIRNYKESHFKFLWDKKLFKEITSYSGWNLFGALAGLANNHGINILLNIFFGPAINAARGIAYQINSSINGFVQNFLKASRPQIIKYYAQKDYESMLKLLFTSSKFSFILLFMISFPILVELPFVLNLWLGKIPDYTILFTRIIIITTLIDCISFSLMTAFQATGKIKIYQIVVGGCMLLNIPISYVLLKQGYPAQSALYCVMVNSLVCLAIRLFLLKKLIKNLSLMKFFRSVLLPICLVFVMAIMPAYFLYDNLTVFSDSVIHVGVVMFLSFLYCLLLIYIFAISREEKMIAFTFVKNKIMKK